MGCVPGLSYYSPSPGDSSAIKGNAMAAGALWSLASFAHASTASKGSPNELLALPCGRFALDAALFFCFMQGGLAACKTLASF